MQINIDVAVNAQWLAVHPLGSQDAATVAAMRAETAPYKGRMQGTAARPAYDEIMNHVLPPAGIAYEEDTVGGMPGWWCRPADALPKAAILHLHGGWFAWGSARAYRHFAGHIAAQAGAAVFVPDYRLAPEHPFPAALQDVQACWQGLTERGVRHIALVGDSAGGALTLALLAITAAQTTSERAAIAGAVALSPVTNLTLQGQSWTTRAEADPYFTLAQVEAMVSLYLNGHNPKDPLASPLFGSFDGLTPLRIHVGEDEMLLDDSLRYAEKAAIAGADVRVDLWQGMPHVFLSSAGKLQAADQALAAAGRFLAEQLTLAAEQQS